jgi:predicted transport protein
MAKTPEEMAAAMIANIKEKTGKDLPEWLATVSKTDHAKHGQIVKFLKTEHGVTHGFANLIAHQALAAATGAAPPSHDALVDTQYGGAKSGLRPIYEDLVAKVHAFGDDVEIAPKKAYVSLRRSKQFALIQPSTKTRVDVGINLKGVDPTKRLEPSGSFNSMCSHRVRVTDHSQVDDELVGWLRSAYDQA